MTGAVLAPFFFLLLSAFWLRINQLSGQTWINWVSMIGLWVSLATAIVLALVVLL